MPYVAKDFGALVGMDGFSEALLKNHFTLYQGYVANTNKLSDLLEARVHEVVRLTETIVEVVVRAPLASREFHPGQFYRLSTTTGAATAIGSGIGRRIGAMAYNPKDRFTSYDEMSAAIILPNLGVPQCLPRTCHSHRQWQQH